MRVALTVAALLLLAGTAQAQRTVINGHTIQFGFVSSVNPDCTARGIPRIIITQQPRHGRARVVRVSDFPSFPQSNIRSVCNRRRVAGTAISYTAQRGYAGPDYLSAEAISPDGHHRRGIFYINVR